MDVRCQYAHQLYSCMHMINLTCRYFNLNFRYNGSVGGRKQCREYLFQLQKFCEVQIWTYTACACSFFHLARDAVYPAIVRAVTACSECDASQQTVRAIYYTW